MAQVTRNFGGITTATYSYVKPVANLRLLQEKRTSRVLLYNNTRQNGCTHWSLLPWWGCFQFFLLIHLFCYFATPYSLFLFLILIVYIEVWAEASASSVKKQGIGRISDKRKISTSWKTKIQLATASAAATLCQRCHHVWVRCASFMALYSEPRRFGSTSLFST